MNSVAHRYFRKFESFHPHPDYPLVDKTVRGRVGPVQVGFFNTITLWCNAFIKSSIATGIPLNRDFDGADLNPIGVGRVCIHPLVLSKLSEQNLFRPVCFFSFILARPR